MLDNKCLGMEAKLRDNIGNYYKKNFIAVWGGGAAAIGFFNFVNQNEFMRGITHGSGLIQYALMCFSFMAVFLIVNMLLRLKIFASDMPINVICGISCVSIVLFMYVCWKQDVGVYNSPADSYLWHKYPTVLVLVILVMLTLLYEAVAANVDFGVGKAQYSIVLFYVLVISLSGYLNYFLEYLSVDYFHGSAIFNSVYNVLHGVPYEETSNSVYGNYALLLAIPMKILGDGEYFDFSRIMSLLTMICVALCIYVIHNLIEKKDIRILCTAALPWIYIFRKTNYWQLWPLRTICPVLLMAWLVFLIKKADNGQGHHKYIFHAVTYLILMFSIVWNKESGMVCLIGYLAFTFFRGAAPFFAKDSKNIWGTILECLIMVTTVFGAYLVVGLYNLIAAGKWLSWEVFLFPLFTKGYMVDSLMLGLQDGIWPWMAVALLFLSIIASIALKILSGKEIDSKEYVYVAAATMGLGLMTYFINRAVYMNLTICYYEAIICIGGIVCSMKKSDYGSPVTMFTRALSTMILVALLAGEILQLGTSLNNKRGSSREEILELRNEIREDAEVDTYAFGINIPELYSILGWKSRSYTTDWADVFITRDAILQKIYHDLESEESIITDKKTFERYEDVAEYVQNLYYVDKVYTYSENVEFYLMRKK